MVSSPSRLKSVVPCHNNFVLNLKARQGKDIPLDKVFASRQMNMLTATAWLLESKEIEEQKPQYSKAELQQMVANTMLLLPPLGIGFGDLKKTAENIPPGVPVKDLAATELLMKATTNCCHRVLDRICCMCCITLLSKVNNQCMITGS